MAAPVWALVETTVGSSRHEDGMNTDGLIPIRGSRKSGSVHFSSFTDKSLIMTPQQQPGMWSDAESFFDDRSSTAIALVDEMRLPTKHAGEHLANPP